MTAMQIIWLLACPDDPQDVFEDILGAYASREAAQAAAAKDAASLGTLTLWHELWDDDVCTWKATVPAVGEDDAVEYFVKAFPVA